MGELRTCPDCGKEVVLVNGGGVYRTILCPDCNREMRYKGDVKTEYVGQNDKHDNYKIVQ